MSTQAPPTDPSPFKLFLLNWAYVFPGVWLFNEALEWIFNSMGIDLSKVALLAMSTGLLSFTIVYAVNAWLLRTFAGWLRQK